MPDFENSQKQLFLVSYKPLILLKSLNTIIGTTSYNPIGERWSLAPEMGAGRLFADQGANPQAFQSNAPRTTATNLKGRTLLCLTYVRRKPLSRKDFFSEQNLKNMFRMDMVSPVRTRGYDHGNVWICEGQH